MTRVSPTPCSLTRFMLEEKRAGGAASTGRAPILDVAPTQLHHRVPVFLGSRNEVAEAVRYHRTHGAASSPAALATA